MQKILALINLNPCYKLNRSETFYRLENNILKDALLLVLNHNLILILPNLSEGHSHTILYPVISFEIAPILYRMFLPQIKYQKSILFQAVKNYNSTGTK